MDEEASSYLSLTKEALQLMKQRLPQYVVDSFVSAGFDTLGVIADMDTSDKPGNSLQAIEEFINSEHPNDVRFTRGTGTFKFPPGHRHTIARFVREVRQLEEDKRRACPKRECDAPCKNPKRRKVVQNIPKEMIIGASDSSSSESVDNVAVSQVGILGDIRRQVTKWQQSQKHAKLRQLKEHGEYEVQVKAKVESGNLMASIVCKLCGKRYSLGQKEGKPMISNWTKHITKCVMTPKRRAKVTGKLHQYFVTSPTSSSNTSVSIPSSPDLFSPAANVDQLRDGALQLSGTDFSTDSLEEPGVLSQDVATDQCTLAHDHHFRLSPP